MNKITLENEQATIEFGRKLGALLGPGDLLLMEGDLGAGKTTMTKGIGQSLGVKRVINSPTFTILKVYEGTIPLYHLDVYRLEGCDDDLGFDEYFEGDGVCVIEWAHYIEDQLPKEHLDITILHEENHRVVCLNPIGRRYEAIVKEVLK